MNRPAPYQNHVHTEQNLDHYLTQTTLVPGGGPFNNGMGGVAQTAGAVSVGILAPAAGIQASGERCIASTFDELKEAVEEKTCPTVLLQGAGKYEMEEEIIVRRRVSIIGNPSLMPTLDAQESPRSFRVMVRRSASIGSAVGYGFGVWGLTDSDCDRTATPLTPSPHTNHPRTSPARIWTCASCSSS